MTPALLKFQACLCTLIRIYARNFVIVVFYFQDKISHSSGCPIINNIAEDELELLILSPASLC